MKQKIFIEQVKENKWLIGAVVFFILWKFFLIHILWQDRSFPPEPDDSYNYISQIAAIADCKGFHFCSYPGVSMGDSTGFVYLSYRLFFGWLAKITQLSSQTIYHFGFYLGTLFLAFTLYPFIKIFSNNKNLIAWSIFFLSLYHGLGETHGFFWVVPSFFSVLLFLILATYTVRNEVKLKAWLILLLAVLYAFSHPMSIFLIFIVPLYLLIFSLFTHKIDHTAWKKMLFVLSITLFSSLLSGYFSPKSAYDIKETLIQAQTVTQTAIGNLETKKNGGVQGPPKPSQDKQPIEKKKTFFSQKIDTLRNVYFRFVFPHWLFIPPFLLCFLVLAHKRQFKILSFYSASFIFFILTTFLNPLGYRSAIIVWPITYILFAFVSWYLIEIICDTAKGWIRNIFLGIIFLLLLLFFSVNAVFALVFNENINVHNSYSIKSEPALTGYLLNEILSKQTVTLPLELMLAEPSIISSLRSRIVPYTAKPDYIIMTDLTKIPREKERSPLFKMVKKTAEKFGFFMQPEKTTVTRYNLPEGYTFEKEFGIFDVYKKTL